MWDSYIVCAVCAVVTAALGIRLRRDLGNPAWVAVSVALMLVNVAAAGLHGWLIVTNARAGCFPWSPAYVAYQPNMTLCPGQTVTMPPVFIPLPAPEPEKEPGSPA